MLTTVTPKGYITEKLHSQPRHSIYVHYGNCSKRHAYIGGRFAPGGILSAGKTRAQEMIHT